LIGWLVGQQERNKMKIQNIKNTINTIKNIGLSVVLALSFITSGVKESKAQDWFPVSFNTNSQTVNYPFIMEDFPEKISRTTLGDEGIRRIGALGDYTLEEFLEDTSTRGPARDLPEFSYNSSNLVVTYSGGDVYDPENGYFKLDPGTKTLTDNAVNYAYWATNDTKIIQWTTGTRPNATDTIYLGTFITSLGKIIHVTPTVAVGDALLYEDLAFANTFPSLIVNGLNVYPTGTDLTNIIMGAGVEYHNLAERNEHQQFNFNTSNKLVIYTHVNTNWATITTNQFPVGKWDDGTNLVACDASKWYRGVFVSIEDVAGQLTWVAPDYEYTNETDAINGSDPDLPPSFIPYIPKSTAYVFKGDDTELRVDTSYWVDRRNSDNLLKGSSVSSSGGGANTPTLSQVLLAGAGTGGILPTGMGDPVTDDQAASKGYVDSTRNKASTGTGYVDPVNGDDITGRPEKASLPYKTIQAAIDGCAAVASDAKRFLVTASIGSYTGNVVMAPYVSLRGVDIEATVIHGQVTVPSTYTDLSGTELQVLTVRMTNAPALVINAGSDDAYFGVRSCGLYSTYTEDRIVKNVVKISRGNAELYATTWIELDVENAAAKRPSTLYYLTTDPANSGSYRVNTFSSSHVMNILDTNDTVSVVFCDATVEGGFFASKSDATLITLNDSTNHANRVTSVVHRNASGVKSFIESSIIEVELSLTNGCDVVGVSSTGSTSSATAYFNNSTIIVPNVNSNALFYGSASGIGDNIAIFNSQIGAQSSAYPKRYTEAGSLGRIAYVIQHASGDIISGGGFDMSSTIPSIIPETGHVKLYTYTYAGLENPMFVDSSTNKVRLARDHFFNGYNSETTPLQVGEAVYVTAGISPANTPIIKRANAGDASKMPCAGIVAQVGGIGTNRIGRVMRGGRLEEYFNTFTFTSGDKLYVGTIDGKLTNAPPTGNNIEQQVGWAHIAASNGLMNVYLWTPNTLGGLTPNKYVTYASPVFSSDLFSLTNSGTAKISAADVPAGATNIYTLPSVGGQLATYTDIQMVPVSVVVGEPDGIIKGSVVYQSGVSGGKPLVKYADKRYDYTLPIIGVASASGAIGAVIEVISFGPIADMDTSTFSPNDLMYLGTNGLLSPAPTTFTDAMILVGTCMTSNSTTGSMLVNIRSYYMDGSFAGSMRYTVKNASSVSNATANFFAINEANEAMRMGIRSTNNFQGAGSYLVNGSNGKLIFGNLRRKGFVWNIDMTDSGDIYNHNNWPMMSLVPQANSNAFLGIGTTNPLAKLHVTGSMMASNSFRLATGAYGNTELVTYGDTTNLINIGDTNLQAQIVTETNRAQVAEGLLSGRIVIETNRAQVAETNLQAQINSSTNSLAQEIINRTAGDINLQAQINSSTNRIKVIENSTSVWNQASITSINATNRLGTIEARTSIWNQASVDAISATNSIAQEIVNRTAGDTNLQAQITSTTNRVNSLETRVKFWANNSGVLQNINNTTAKVLFTNSISGYGSTYTATTARWVPGVSGVTVRIWGLVNFNMGNGETAIFIIRKNNNPDSTVIRKRAANAADELGQNFDYIDVTTSSTDYYELWGTTSASTPMLGTAKDNWWAGEILKQ
jgi:hypothetical protein